MAQTSTPAFDTSSLPYLNSVEFSSILDWQALLRDALRQIYPTPKFPVQAIIAPAVVDLCQARLGTQGAFPEELAPALKLLYQGFAPRSEIAKAEFIQRYVWKEPVPKRGDLVVTSSLLAFNISFKEAVEALSLTEKEAQVSYYHKALHGEVHRLLQPYLANHPGRDLSSAMAEAVRDAQIVDDVCSYGFYNPSAISVTKAYKTPSGHPTTSSTTSPTRRLITPKLTPAELAKCKAEKLCIRCRQPGHFAANCPVK